MSNFRRSASNFWKIFRRSRMGLVGAFLLITMLLVAMFAPLLTPYTPTQIIRNANNRPLIYAPPSVHPPLGTDDAGHDVWTQLVFGARVSLLVGFVAGFISVFIGSTLGTLAGFYGGKTDTLLMRTIDVFLVIPDLPLTIILIAVIRQANLGIPTLAVLIAVIGLLYWTTSARQSHRRGQRAHHAQAHSAAGAAVDDGQHGARHLDCHPGRIRARVSGAGRSVTAVVGHHAALC